MCECMCVSKDKKNVNIAPMWEPSLSAGSVHFYGQGKCNVNVKPNNKNVSNWGWP